MQATIRQIHFLEARFWPRKRIRFTEHHERGVPPSHYTSNVRMSTRRWLLPSRILKWELQLFKGGRFHYPNMFSRDQQSSIETIKLRSTTQV